MLQVAFAGTFAARLEQPARRHLTVRCEIIASDEDGIIPRFGEVDVLVAMAFTDAMARAASRLKLVQVPGAGLDRIDRSALPDGVYEPGRLVTELTGWIGDRFGLSAGGACRCHGERPVRWTNGRSLSLGFWRARMR